VSAGDPAVEHPHLIRGRHDVGQHQRVFIGNGVGKLVERRLRERDANELGLGAVDQVPEDPTAAAPALSVAAGPAVAAPAAGRDARDENPGANGEVPHPRTDLDNRADRLMAEDASLLDLRHIAFENMEVCSADGDGIDPDDRIVWILEVGQRHRFPRTLSGPPVYERLHHGCSPCLIRRPIWFGWSAVGRDAEPQ